MNMTSEQTENPRGTLADSVYETLLEQIIAGQLKPGTVVSEVQLARDLNVSRTPVHDALRQLTSEGLVEQRSGRRAVIASFSQDDIHDIFEMRKLLEAEATRQAATKLDRPTLTRLRSVAEGLTGMEDNPTWLSRWGVADEDFHETIARASGNPRLHNDIVRYRLLHRGFNLRITTFECLQQALQEHLRILDALANRDAERAGAEMRTHIQEWQAYFVNHLPIK